MRWSRFAVANAAGGIAWSTSVATIAFIAGPTGSALFLARGKYRSRNGRDGVVAAGVSATLALLAAHTIASVWDRARPIASALVVWRPPIRFRLRALAQQLGVRYERVIPLRWRLSTL